MANPPVPLLSLLTKTNKLLRIKRSTFHTSLEQTTEKLANNISVSEINIYNIIENIILGTEINSTSTIFTSSIKTETNSQGNKIFKQK
ncbi:20399_t:CDS:1, partial [Funneliformis geosporum]